MQLVFATNNNHKINEIQKLLKGSNIELLSLRDIDCDEELPETGNTLQANAQQKAMHIYEKYGMNCFADDTGLLVDALNGEPGVYSARYAGMQRNADDNMRKLILELRGKENRNAHFSTVIALVINGECTFFEGSVEGTILSEMKGSEGFGYDPIFLPNGYEHTFAQMSAEEKNQLSHRGKAVRKLAEYLKAGNI